MRKTASKRKNISNNRTGKIFVAAKYLGIVLVLSAIYVLISFASGVLQSAFRIKSIVIAGNEHLTDDELKKMAGLQSDDNLLRVSNKKITLKLEETPWIRSVSVRKEFPDRLLISIIEAEPFALLDMKGKLFIVDDRGVMLEELNELAIPFLPVVSSDPYKEREAFMEAITLAKAIKSTAVLSRKEHIEIISHKPQELSLNIDGVVVKIGTGEYEDKLSRLSDIEEEIKSRKIPVDYIDLRFANRVLVSPVNEVIR